MLGDCNHGTFAASMTPAWLQCVLKPALVCTIALLQVPSRQPRRTAPRRPRLRCPFSWAAGSMPARSCCCYTLLRPQVLRQRRRQRRQEQGMAAQPLLAARPLAWPAVLPVKRQRQGGAAQHQWAWEGSSRGSSSRRRWLTAALCSLCSLTRSSRRQQLVPMQCPYAFMQLAGRTLCSACTLMR